MPKILHPVNNHPNYPVALLDQTVKHYIPPLSRVTKDVLQGLSEKEIDTLMPIVLNISPNKPEFKEKVSKYIKELNVAVPYTGLTLEVTPEELKGEKQPRNIEHFIIYKTALVDTNVAKTEEDVANKGYFSYYIVDTDKIKAKEVDLHKVKNEVLAIYSKIILEEDAVNTMRSVAIIHRDVLAETLMEIASMNEVDLQMAFKKICDSKPEEVKKLFKDEAAISRIKIIADSEAYIEAGLVSLIGESVHLDDEMIARSRTDFRRLLASEAGSKYYAILQSKYTELIV